MASERYASGPMAAKCARSSASVTSYGRFPTKRRTAMPCFSSVNGVWPRRTRDAAPVSMPVRRGYADGRMRAHSGPGARSSPPRLRATSGRRSVVIRVVIRRDSCGAVRQLRPMVCGWAAPRASWRRLLPQQRPPQRAAVSHSWDLPAGSARFTTGFTRLGLVDREGTAFELCAVEPLDGRFGRLALGHLDKAKAFGAPGVTVGNDIDLVHNSASITASATFGHSASPDNVTCWHIMALQ